MSGWIPDWVAVVRARMDNSKPMITVVYDSELGCIVQCELPDGTFVFGFDGGYPESKTCTDDD
jgi:hypothetical protein